ncbi:uncharacterized protein BDV14DRAFT_180391 [Aspergillus stella-maris]|uniref:uncharacterized protein n=1 Tax=Aspergillus stella-maris TaxID=1810926 RepID=UPI003CCD80E1
MVNLYIISQKCKTRRWRRRSRTRGWFRLRSWRVRSLKEPLPSPPKQDSSASSAWLLSSTGQGFWKAHPSRRCCGCQGLALRVLSKPWFSQKHEANHSAAFAAMWV